MSVFDKYATLGLESAIEDFLEAESVTASYDNQIKKLATPIIEKLISESNYFDAMCFISELPHCSARVALGHVANELKGKYNKSKEIKCLK